MNRREYIRSIAAAGAAATLPSWAFADEMLIQRTIPSTQQKLAAVGVGTWQTFDIGSSGSDREPRLQVLSDLVKAGGSVIDSSPMYGRSEEVVGTLSAEAKVNDKLFVATKVWTSGESQGIDQMNTSFRLLRRSKMDLMQIHNLVDWQTHLKTLRKWKEEGKVKYIGLTHYVDSMHDTLMRIATDHPVDFIQVNYNLMDRHAEERLLPFAREKGIAVLINRPFEEGALFRKVKGQEIPGWATEAGCKSWAQVFLKFILANPAVTCVIPGTSNPVHLADNLGAGRGALPDAATLKKMVALFA